MKRVVIVRHAKSVHYGYEDDFNRDLSDRGKNDAKLVSTEMYKKGILPDVMISSPAKRAMKTARIFAENLHFEKRNISEEQDIYDGLTTSEFLELNTSSCLRMWKLHYFFGHNPGFYYFVSNLLEIFHDEMPTCSSVGIDFEVDIWQECAGPHWSKSFSFFPRMLK